MQHYDVLRNKLHEIACVSLTLGLVIGAALVCLVSRVNTRYDQVLAYLLILSCYHLSEFLLTSKYQNGRTTSKSFLIYGNRGNKEFIGAQIFTIWEYFMRRSKFFTQLTGMTYETNYLMVMSGLLLILCGLAVRAGAMITCGTSFSHYIQTSKESGNQLITHGIYAWCRHPSYLGFYLMAVGIQLFMENYIATVLDIAIMSYFFTIRIQFEEWFLVHRLYGQAYIDYKKRVGVWIPFVRVKQIL